MTIALRATVATKSMAEIVMRRRSPRRCRRRTMALSPVRVGGSSADVQPDTLTPAGGIVGHVVLDALVARILMQCAIVRASAALAIHIACAEALALVLRPDWARYVSIMHVSGYRACTQHTCVFAPCLSWP